MTLPRITLVWTDPDGAWRTCRTAAGEQLSGRDAAEVQLAYERSETTLPPECLVLGTPVDAYDPDQQPTVSTEPTGVCPRCGGKPPRDGNWCRRCVHAAKRGFGVHGPLVRR